MHSHIGSQVCFQSSHSAYLRKARINFTYDFVDSVLLLHFRFVYLPVQYRKYVISTGCIWFGVFPDYLVSMQKVVVMWTKTVGGTAYKNLI